MGGKGETVTYTRFFVKKLNNQAERDALKAKIDTIIQNTGHSLTIIALEGTGPLPGGGGGYSDFDGKS